MDQSPAITATPPLSRMFRGGTGVVFILLCAMYFILYVDRVNLSMAAPIIKTEFHLSNTQLGLVLSAFGYCYAAFQIIGGFAGDRFGGRRTLTALLCLCAAGTFFTGLAGGIGTLILARLLVGLGEAGTLPNGARVISAWVPVIRRGFAMGFVHSAARLSAALTPPIVIGLMYFVGWRGAFVVLGFVSLAWAITWSIYFRDNPKEHRGVTSAENAVLPPYMPYSTSSVRVPWRKLCLRMLPVTLVYFCQAWTLWLYLSWLPTFFLQSYHLDLKHSAFFSAAVFGAGVVGNTVGGLLTDRIYRRTGDVTKARRNTVAVGLSCSLICLIFVLFLRDLTLLTLALSSALFFLQACEGALWSVPIDIAPKYAGVASGIMNTSAGVAAIISPLAFGAIADLSGSYRVPFIASIMLLGVGVGLSFLIRPDIKISEELEEPTLGEEPKPISL
jgi:sugar phosphate permease